MPPKLFKAADVCEIVQVQPYVLRSWEKEFPGIGVQKSAESARLYRQSDVDQVLRIKQLVFGEGLTLAGARKRLEESVPAPESTSGVSDEEVAEVLDALASDARTRIANVRQGLKSILSLLSNEPGSTVVVVDDYQLQPPPPQPARTTPARAASRPVSKAIRGKAAPTKRAKRAAV